MLQHRGGSGLGIQIMLLCGFAVYIKDDQLVILFISIL